MPWWNQLLLSAYYHAGLPRRSWRNYAAGRAGAAPVVVLFYHRVADTSPTPWSISNQLFARQMDWLSRRFEMVSLAEAQRRIRGGVNRRICVSITFDDGYAVNCRGAIPLLLKRRIPCTYFVTLRNALEAAPFRHDIAAGYHFPPNTIDQLREMAAAGIEIGAHGRNHVDMGGIDDPRELYDEIVTAGRDLADAVGAPVRYFAFPYGLHDNLRGQAFQMAQEAGYDGVCSAYGGYNFPGDDPFHIQRAHGDPQMIRLKNWVTVDPRKVRSTLRFQYTRYVRTEEAKYQPPTPDMDAMTRKP